MKNFKTYFQFRRKVDEVKHVPHTTEHAEEIIRDIAGNLDDYLAMLRQSAYEMSNDIDQYRANKINPIEFSTKLRSLKRLATVTLMKIETGWE